MNPVGVAAGKPGKPTKVERAFGREGRMRGRDFRTGLAYVTILQVILNRRDEHPAAPDEAAAAIANAEAFIELTGFGKLSLRRVLLLAAAGFTPDVANRADVRALTDSDLTVMAAMRGVPAHLLSGRDWAQT